MSSQGELLAVTEAQFREASTKRRDAARNIEDSQNRLTEITALLERFTLLQAHYRSDAARLHGIAEAGSLFGALVQGPFPLCGATADQHQRHNKSDG